MFKKIIAILSITAALFSSAAAFAENEVTITVDGAPITLDTPAFIDGDKTMVPIRGIFEKVGSQVSWDNDTKTIIINRQSNNELSFVMLQIGSDIAFVNEEKKSLDTPPVIINDRTFVPLRFIIESLGKKVEWNQDTKTVSIITE